MCARARKRHGRRHLLLPSPSPALASALPLVQFLPVDKETVTSSSFPPARPPARPPFLNRSRARSRPARPPALAPSLSPSPSPSLARILDPSVEFLNEFFSRHPVVSVDKNSLWMPQSFCALFQVHGSAGQKVVCSPLHSSKSLH